MTDIIKRFFDILKEKNMSAYAYNKLNPKISTQKISNFKNGRNNITLETILSISKTFDNVSLDWLLTGRGGMYKNSNNAEKAVFSPTSYMKVPMVPIHAQAGFPSGYGDTAYMDELPTLYWEVDKNYKGNYVCFEVQGDSMDDETAEAILDGDKLLTREVQRHLWKSKLHLKWNFVIVHREEGIIVKKITEHSVENGIIKCHSLNPMWEDFELNLNDVIALFNVVDLKRKPLV